TCPGPPGSRPRRRSRRWTWPRAGRPAARKGPAPRGRRRSIRGPHGSGAAGREEPDRQKAEDEAADMGEERDAAALLGRYDRLRAEEELEQEPDPEEQKRGQFEEEKRNHPREDAPAREEHDVGAEHGRDRTARAAV